MKKLATILLLISIFAISIGCSKDRLKYTLNRQKPNTYYYTDMLVKEIKINGISNVLTLETNLNKERNLKDEDIKSLINFFNLIKTKNFLASSPKLPKKPEFKFYISSGNEKYVINVYNEKYISVHPWDGNYPMDYIDMTDMKPLYNLYYFCKYIFEE
ncbi:hypothetical protein N3C_0364 [Clostridium sp. N3C]|uniref:DUF4883 family protein n=1 Tax=Clostridium sp. N3C TaxID=1776758 RepID=UPI00092E0E50|nr:DUF4883 family protein [Clostridium sp. N3C]SCN21685.1 hypothetical protein N3C_0364 [Clostridium sp. N3C]